MPFGIAANLDIKNKKNMENKIILSILICTIEGREHFYERLQNELIRQIKTYNLLGKVQILNSKDKRGEHQIGYKRNLLLQNCDGEYAMFIDDDDMICNDALYLIMEKIKSENPDVISLSGIITVDGKDPRVFKHSLKYTEWFEKDGIYCRPPNHLNVIKTKISKQFRFPEINNGEDKEWSMAICKSGVLKKESIIDKVYYFYDYVSTK